MPKLSSETVHLVHRSKHSRLTNEDFVILVVFSQIETQQEIIHIMKNGDFTTYADVDSKGAIGSALMFAPNVIVFDWDHNAQDFENTRHFIRTERLAKHLEATKFVVLVKSDNPNKQKLYDLEDPHLHVIEYDEDHHYAGQLKKHVLRFFLKAQKEFQEAYQMKNEEQTVESTKHQRTSSLKDLLVQHKNFADSVLRTFQLIIKKVSSGDVGKIFDLISKTLEGLNRPFILKYKDNHKEVSVAQRDTERLQILLEETTRLSTENKITKLHSDQDRRCFFGDNKHLFFAIESPTVFDELDTFSTITKNFEMFLSQAENRKKQLLLMGDFRDLFDNLYGQLESFEWSESLEQMQEVVNQMFSIDSLQEEQEEEEEVVSGELQLF